MKILFFLLITTACFSQQPPQTQSLINYGVRLDSLGYIAMRQIDERTTTGGQVIFTSSTPMTKEQTAAYLFDLKKQIIVQMSQVDLLIEELSKKK